MKVLCEGIGKHAAGRDGSVYPHCPDCGREFSAQGRKATARLASSARAAGSETGNPWIAIPKHYVEFRGEVIFDSYFGHVCTCTAHRHSTWSDQRDDYERTVVSDPSSGTESGTFTYRCERCGASTRSGL